MEEEMNQHGETDRAKSLLWTFILMGLFQQLHRSLGVRLRITRR